MSKKHIIGLFLAVFSGLSANAQFTGVGNEPTYVKWSQINTDNYKVIYPRGLDSLARVYAVALEQTALSVGESVGYSPNQMFKRPMPVVLHPHTSYSNGQVAWTPRLMDLYTVPDAFTPSTMPWEKHLVLHESRHVAQMQYNTDGIFKIGKVLSGELLGGGLAAIYCGPAFFEGDAVVAETAMSSSGRGRSADFLEHYRYHITTENSRNYYQWRYSSQKTYIPDHYRLGYIHFAGLRSLYDTPDFTARYFQNIKDAHGFSFFNFSKTSKQISGLNRANSFKAITDSLRNFWLADNERRGPFMQPSQITAPTKKYSEYTDLVAAEEEIYAVRTSIVDIPKVVRIASDGSVEPLARIGNIHSPLKYSPATGEIIWCEFVPDARWEMLSYAEIKSMDRRGDVRTLLHSRRQRFFNPDPHPTKPLIAVVCYPEEGGSRIRIMSAHDADAVAAYASPPSMQYLAPLWVGEELYTSAITEEGIGIYRVSDGATVLEPGHTNIDRLFTDGERIYFASDVSGVRELYSVALDGSGLQQHSLLEDGGGDFLLHDNALYFSALCESGRAIVQIPASEMLAREASLKQNDDAYPFVGDLAASELDVDYEAEVEVGEVEPYSKIGHAVNVHSWVPVYVDPDAVSELSFSSLTTSAGIGATAFFQNSLGTLSGTAAYRALQDGYFRSSGHLSLKYSGLYPVIETKLYLNTRQAIEYNKTIEKEQYVLKSKYMDKPLVMADVSAYVPWNLSRSGLNIGIIPKVNIVFTNDLLLRENKLSSMTRQMTSIRAYVIQSVPNSRIYPRWGIGAELAYSSRPLATDVVNPISYAYIYAYTPGLHSTHGIRFTSLYENTPQKAIFSEGLSTTTPRGFSSVTRMSLAYFKHKLRLTLDYAMPIIPLDCGGLGDFAYLRNFELSPHFDFSLYGEGKNIGSLYSLGAEFTLRMGNLAFIPYDTRIGVGVRYLGGSLYNALEEMGAENKQYSLDLVLTIDL